MVDVRDVRDASVISTSSGISSSIDSSILYVVVARGATPLAEFAGHKGNFSDVSRIILQKLPEEATTTSYRYGDYWVRYSASTEGLVLLCIGGSFSTADLCFRCLDAVRGRFHEQYGHGWRRLQELELNGSFRAVLRSTLEYYNSPEVSTVSRVRGQLAEVKEVTHESIDKILERHEKIEMLVDKTEQLSRTAHVFRRDARQLRVYTCRRAWKQVVCLSVLVVLAILLVWVWSCGWDLCLHGQNPNPQPQPTAVPHAETHLAEESPHPTEDSAHPFEGTPHPSEESPQKADESPHTSEESPHTSEESLNAVVV
jgi:vesicle-associated membrane protein 7